MSKYIRTKDGEVFDLERYENKNSPADKSSGIITLIDKKQFRDLTIFAKDIIKETDTIEELCDCFVYQNKIYSLERKIDGSRYLDRYCLGGYDHHDTVDLDKAEIKCFEEFIPEHRKNTYGAIWTDEGLIYVAKMNENGELELL